MVCGFIMNLEKINEVLSEEAPSKLISAAFFHKGRELFLVFTWDGGKNEDKAFLLKFKQAAVFHIPSILYATNSRVTLDIAPGNEAIKYIPSVSFDEGEFNNNASYKIFLLKNIYGKETGYYIAAESVESEWISYH
jgi:hypothetical protein